MVSGGRPSPLLVQISFSPQPSAAIEIKDGGHKFLELEWSVGEDLPHSWYKFLSLPSLPLPLKSKMAAINEKILSTWSLKLRLFCRLGVNLLFLSVRHVLLQHGLVAKRFGDEGHISIVV